MVSWSKVQVNAPGGAADGFWRLSDCGAWICRRRSGARPRLAVLSTGGTQAGATRKQGIETRAAAIPSLAHFREEVGFRLSNSGGTEATPAARRGNPWGASKVGFSSRQQGWPGRGTDGWWSEAQRAPARWKLLAVVLEQPPCRAYAPLRLVTSCRISDCWPRSPCPMSRPHSASCRPRCRKSASPDRALPARCGIHRRACAASRRPRPRG